MVTHPGSLLRGQQVAGRCLEELQHRGVREGRRVRHVHDDVRARERLGQPLAGQGVDARRGCRRHGLMAEFTEDGHEFLPDEPAAADHNNLHVESPDCRPLRGDWNAEPYSTSATDQRDSLSGLLVMYTARTPPSICRVTT